MNYLPKIVVEIMSVKRIKLCYIFIYNTDVFKYLIQLFKYTFGDLRINLRLFIIHVNIICYIFAIVLIEFFFFNETS